MDCKTARFLLDYHRPERGELPPEEVAELERHLAGCAECDATGRAERRFDEALAPAMNDVPVPEGLKDRLLSRLREERGAVLRRRVAWAARVAAVAAAVLLGVGLWLHYRVEPVPSLDVSQLAEQDWDQRRDLSQPALAREKVQGWFQSHQRVNLSLAGFMVAPAEFNYGSLIDYHLVEVQGKAVPKLAFANDSTWANVYVIRRDQFQVNDLVAEKFETFNQRVVIWRPKPEQPDTAYVIFWGGLNLETLMAAGDRN